MYSSFWFERSSSVSEASGLALTASTTRASRKRCTASLPRSSSRTKADRGVFGTGGVPLSGDPAPAPAPPDNDGDRSAKVEGVRGGGTGGDRAMVAGVRGGGTGGVTPPARDPDRWCVGDVGVPVEVETTLTATCGGRTGKMLCSDGRYCDNVGARCPLGACTTHGSVVVTSTLSVAMA
jgi:hypothetical protein